jgi:hypothetical protein
MRVGSTLASSFDGGVLFAANGGLLAQDSTSGFIYSQTTNTKFLKIGGGSSVSEIRLHPTNNHNGYISFKAPSLPPNNSYSYTLPSSYGTAGYVLSTDGAGLLSWVAGGTTGPGGSSSFDAITSGTNNTAVMIVSAPANIKFGPSTAKYQSATTNVSTFNLESYTDTNYEFTQIFAAGSACLQIANGQYADPRSLGRSDSIEKINLATGDNQYNFIQLYPTIQNASGYTTAFQLHGIDDVYPGRRIYIKNAGDYDILIRHDSNTCVDKRFRILTPYGVDMLMRPRDYYTFMYDGFAQSTQNLSASSYNYGRWILVDGYDSMMNDPTCVTQIYDDFMGGTTTTGNIGSTGYSISKNNYGGALLNASSGYGSSDAYVADGYVTLSTGSGYSGHAYMHYDSDDGSTSTVGRSRLKFGTIWECLVKIPQLTSANQNFKVLLGISNNSVPYRAGDNAQTSFPGYQATNFHGFQYDSASQNWKITNCIAPNGWVFYDSLVAATTDWIHFKIIYTIAADPDQDAKSPKIEYWINNQKIDYNFSNPTTTSVPLYTTVIGISKYQSNSVYGEAVYVDVDFTKYTVFHRQRRIPILSQYNGVGYRGYGGDNYGAANPISDAYNNYLFNGLAAGGIPAGGLPVIGVMV